MDTPRRAYLNDKLIDAQCDCVWATHRLSFGFDGPPAWCESQRVLQQQTVDHHRLRIATLRAKLGAIEDPGLAFGESTSLPKFLKRAAAAE